MGIILFHICIGLLFLSAFMGVKPLADLVVSLILKVGIFIFSLYYRMVASEKDYKEMMDILKKAEKETKIEWK
jgi:hypothetical protein